MKRNTLFVLSLLCGLFIVFSCQKELSFEQPVYPVAEGSLWDTAGLCLPDSVHGTFYNGVQPGSDTAYVEVQVDVTVAGTYNISTDLQNGFMFRDSGLFVTTGINTIKLKPVGMPVIIEPTTFTFSFDSTTCGFVVNVQDSTGTGLGGVDTTTNPPADSINLSDTAWKLYVDTLDYYHGQITATYLVDSIGSKYLTLMGTDVNTGDTTFTLGILFSSTTIEPGTYTSSQRVTFALNTADTAQQDYHADLGSSVSGLLTVEILTYDSVTGIITGTITGTAVDNDSQPVSISNGTFKAKVT